MFPIAECRLLVLYRFAHRNTARYAVAASGNASRPSRSSRFKAALKLSASALSALDPTAPMDCFTPYCPHNFT